MCLKSAVTADDSSFAASVVLSGFYYLGKEVSGRAGPNETETGTARKTERIHSPWSTVEWATVRNYTWFLFSI